MDYHHKSGAKKRSEQKEREKRASAGRRTLESLGFTISSQSNTAVSENIKEATAGQTSVSPQTDNKTIVIETSSNSSISENIKPDNVELLNFYVGQTAGLPHPDSETTVIKASSSFSFYKNIEPDTNVQLLNFDVGLLVINSRVEIEDAVRRGPEPFPKILPVDRDEISFPNSVLSYSLRNGEMVSRDWLVWSRSKQALFCFPCRIFSKLPEGQRSILTTSIGWKPSKGYRKLYNRIPEHQNSNNHRECYLEWRNLQNNLNNNATVNCLILKQIDTETQIWKDLLRRFLDVVLFLSERGLAFRGSSHLINDPRNGNFLGILELISHYDPLLAEHLKKVKKSQLEKKRLQVHYLSSEIQNEFISSCAEYVFSCILKERETAKYFSILVDATPDSAHMEQTAFVLRYVIIDPESDRYKVVERFMAFVNCNKTTGEAIASLILDTLQKYNIPISDCRGQGYDNGSNMAGLYKGAQARILDYNPLAIFSPCACHSLNLCGVQAAECCPEAIKFFGVLQKLYNIFSSSPERWKFLLECIGCSLHSMSNTRWSARLESVKPFVNNIPGIRKAIDAVLELNLTSEIRTDLNSINLYTASFECVLMASIWLKVLTSINQISTVLQARNATIDVEVANLSSLLESLNFIRGRWEAIFAECQVVAENLKLETDLPICRQRGRKRQFEETVDVDDRNVTRQQKFQQNVFNVLLDTVIGNMTTRFEAAKRINQLFSVLWTFTEINNEEISQKGSQLQSFYKEDISEDIIEELLHLKSIYKANINQASLPPLELINILRTLKLEILFPNVVVALRIFGTIPVTIAQAERSFSCLSRIKNILRSTMAQDRLQDLGLLSIEAELAKQCDFSKIINLFATKKARKARLI